MIVAQYKEDFGRKVLIPRKLVESLTTIIEDSKLDEIDKKWDKIMNN